MTDNSIVLIGAGQAAAECAMRIRRHGHDGPITIIGAEPHPPYNRPPLSKAMLTGAVTPDTLLLRPAAAYAAANITLHTGIAATAIDRDTHQIHLADGQTIPYGTLVIATGGSARRLTCEGAELAGVLTLRTIADSAALAHALTEGVSIVIVGGGYVGLEVASVAAGRGARVTVIEAAPRLLARVACPELANFYAEIHRAAGVTIELGCGVASLTPAHDHPDRVGGVTLSDGRVIAANLVLVGIGLVPETALAQAAGLAVENGIVVDATCRTADPAIYAIGDCAQHDNDFLGAGIRLESVPSATDHARIAADAIMGRDIAPLGAPWFWSEQYDLKMQSVGLRQFGTGSAEPTTVLRGDYTERAFLLGHFQGPTLVAVDAVNRGADFMVARRLVAMRATPDSTAFADTDRPLKSLIPIAA